MSTEWDALSFEQKLQNYVTHGWKVISDGQSGVQLEKPKQMKGLDKACLAFGVLTFWIYGIGFFFILIALIDYWLLTKGESVYLPRK